MAMREDQVLRPTAFGNRPAHSEASANDSSAIDPSSDSTSKKHGGYDPTKVKLPPNAIIAARGDRQIAYPPQFPRARINGTPEGVTSVHIGVRPRMPPREKAPANSESSGVVNSGAKGKSKDRGQGVPPRELRDWSSRREGYGEVHSDVQDGSSTTGSSRSGSTSRQDNYNRRRPSNAQATSSNSNKDKRSTPAGQQRALPRMTLEQAMLQYEKDHPNARAPSLHGNGRKGQAVAGPSADWETSGGGPAHDGIYTYDYSGTSGASNTTRTGVSAAGTSSSSARSHGSVLHVDGTEGPVHAYPPPPEHENAYGVPFGKRLKALVNMRKEAEANGSVPMADGADLRKASPRKGNQGTGLARRPAVALRESAFSRMQNGLSQDQMEAGRQRKGLRLQDGSQSDIVPHEDSGRVEFSDSTPIQSPPCRNTPTLPQTPSTSPQKRGGIEQTYQVMPRSAVVTPSSKSEPPQRRIEGKQRRKPVPEYIGEGNVVDRLAESDAAPIRKQRSESNVKQDVAGSTKEHRRRDEKYTSPRKSQTPRPNASPYPDRQIVRGAPGDDNPYIPSKALPKDPRPSSISSFYSKSPAGQRSTNAKSTASYAGVAPPMPDGEEYDSDTEAERQAAWAEYYQMMGVNQAAADLESVADEAGQAHLSHLGLDEVTIPRTLPLSHLHIKGIASSLFGNKGVMIYPSGHRDVDPFEAIMSSSACVVARRHWAVVSPQAVPDPDYISPPLSRDGCWICPLILPRSLLSLDTDFLLNIFYNLDVHDTMFMYPPPFYGPIHNSPGFPYNTGAVPEYAAMSGAMPGMRPPMGIGMGMPMHPGLPMTPGMLYGYHPGMAPSQMGMDPAAMRQAGQAMTNPPDRASGGSAKAPSSRPQTIAGRGAAYLDGRKDVRFAGASATPPNLTPRQLNYSGWRYPAPQGGYFSQEHTPASSAMPSPAVDAANPMELYASDGAGYPQYGHYGYSPYSQYPSYPNTPSIRSAAGYNAQSDPFNFEEMAEAVNQPKHSTQADASLQDRRKKSWYGPRQ